MDTKEHWERAYGAKAPDQVSWFRPHLETSLALIERVACNHSASDRCIAISPQDTCEEGFEGLAGFAVSQGQDRVPGLGLELDKPQAFSGATVRVRAGTPNDPMGL
jgi:hypothetical protein